MQKITDHKVPNIDEVDELPDINILPVNFIKNGNSDEPETSQPEARSSKSTPKRKTSIVVPEDEEVEEFEINQAAENTVKLTESAVRRLSSCYLERYRKEIKLTDLKKDETAELLKHFFLEIRDTRKETFGKEYETATLTVYRNGLRRYFLKRREVENFDIVGPLSALKLGLITPCYIIMVLRGFQKSLNSRWRIVDGRLLEMMGENSPSPSGIVLNYSTVKKEY